LNKEQTSSIKTRLSIAHQVTDIHKAYRKALWRLKPAVKHILGLLHEGLT
jgi:hypothetical protein